MKCQLHQILRIPLFWNMKPVGCQLWQLYSAFIFSDLKVREERPHSSLTSRIPSGSGVISQKNGIPPPQSQIIHGTHMHQTCLPAIYNYRLVHGCSDKRLDLSWKGNRFESRLDCRLLWCRNLWYFSVEILEDLKCGTAEGRWRSVRAWQKVLQTVTDERNCLHTVGRSKANC